MGRLEAGESVVIQPLLLHSPMTEERKEEKMVVVLTSCRSLRSECSRLGEGLGLPDGEVETVNDRDVVGNLQLSRLKRLAHLVTRSVVQ